MIYSCAGNVKQRQRARRLLLHGLAEPVAEVRIRHQVLRTRRAILDLHADLTDEGVQVFELIFVFETPRLSPGFAAVISNPKNASFALSHLLCMGYSARHDFSRTLLTIMYKASEAGALEAEFSRMAAPETHVNAQ
jgi:hypothetical protein